MGFLQGVFSENHILLFAALQKIIYKTDYSF